MGKPSGQLLLELGISPSHFRVGTEIVSESQVTVDFRVAQGIHVNVMSMAYETVPNMRPAEVAPPGETQFAHGLVTQLLHGAVETVHHSDIPHDREDVDDGLRRETRNRRAPYVVDIDKLASEDRPQPLGFLKKLSRPRGIVRNDPNLAYRSVVLPFGGRVSRLPEVVTYAFAPSEEYKETPDPEPSPPRGKRDRPRETPLSCSQALVLRNRP